MFQTLVIQSQRQPLPHAWIQRCFDSVREWANRAGFEYHLIDDALFDYVDADLREKTVALKVIASDLARLRWAQQVLAQGYDCVVWCDADFLIFDAPGFELPAADCAVGRETWVQRDGERIRVYPKVHNAFLMFRRGNALLDFYADTAARLLRLNQGPVPPQFIGPKLLSALHNIARFPVMDAAGMLSPPVMRDLLAGGGPALDRFYEASPAPLAGANLSASLCEREGLDESAMSRLIELLLEQGRA
jgi:hypothetical protein